MAKKSDLQKVGFNQTASASSTGIAPLHGSHAALPITCDASNARIMAVGEYPSFETPGMRFWLQSICTRRSEMPHFSAACGADIYSIILPSFLHTVSV